MNYSISTKSARSERGKPDARSFTSRHEQGFSPTEIQIDAMAHFLQGATGDLEHRFTTSRHRDIARTFLERLHNDLGYHELIITVSEHETGADATIDMRLQQTTVLLEIGWAVD